MRTVLKSAILATLAILALALPGRAADGPVLIELYTSQGCDACPPADRQLASLAERDDVVALSLHVDYWDYLGWRDTFARPEFTARQQAYRDAWDKNVLYTPQMIVQGSRNVRATDPHAISAAIDRALSPPDLIEVSIQRANGMVKCRIVPGPKLVTGTVWVAKYTLRETVEITRGENAGRTMTYRNVVSSLMRIGAWSGKEAEEVEMPHPEPGEGVAIWVQNGRSGPVHAAAKLDNPAR